MLQKSNPRAIRSSTDYEDDDNQGKLFYKTSVILNLVNMFVLGFGMTLIVVGMLYLTVYRYEYSFTIFSIDLMSGFFLASGIIMISLSILAVFLIKPYEKPLLVVIYSAVLFVIFLLFFLLGVIGLAMNGNGEFSDQIKDNMNYVGSRYDFTNQYRHETRKMDWAQQKFKCCGINSFADWRYIFSNNRFGTGSSNINNVPYNAPPYRHDNFQGNNFNQPRGDVPDSCCMAMSAGCGRQLSLIGREQQGSIIYTDGCHSLYLEFFSKDIVFLCTVSLLFSIGLLFISATLLFSFTLIRKNYEILLRSTK